MLAEDFIFGLGITIITAKGAGEFTIGIVGTSDKGAKFTELKREYPVFAACAFTRVRAVFFIGEDLRAERIICLLYTSPSPRDGLLSRMPSSA